MSEETHTPYYSKRLRVATLSSPKDFVGMLERTVEITFGNQDAKLIRNKEDISEILEQKDMISDLDELWMGLDEWAEKRGKTFIDKRPEVDTK